MSITAAVGAAVEVEVMATAGCPRGEGSASMITAATGLTVELDVTYREDTGTQIYIKHVPAPWTLQQRGRVLLLAAEPEPVAESAE